MGSGEWSLMLDFSSVADYKHKQAIFLTKSTRCNDTLHAANVEEDPCIHNQMGCWIQSSIQLKIRSEHLVVSFGACLALLSYFHRVANRRRTRRNFTSSITFPRGFDSVAPVCRLALACCKIPKTRPELFWSNFMTRPVSSSERLKVETEVVWSWFWD